MQKRQLPRELGFSSDVRTGVRSSHRIRGVKDDINGEGDVSGPWVRSRVRVRGSIRCMGAIGLQ